MALPLPSTLSPSKVTTFTDCGLAFRFSAIERVPEPPSLAATRGSIVHAALQRLLDLAPAERTRARASVCLDEALDGYATHPELVGLDLDEAAHIELRADAEHLLDGYFALEDPATIHPIGLELQLEAEVDGVVLRGIIDRLELDASGALVVTDYKTGRAPGVAYEQKRLGGVAFYSLLCEQVFGVRPARVQLLHLADPVRITTEPTERSTRGVRQRLGAIWAAVGRACEREDFRPNPSSLCKWCAFSTWCPAWGGDPDLAPSARIAEATTPVATTPVAPTPVATTPVAPTPVAPTPVASAGAAA